MRSLDPRLNDLREWHRTPADAARWLEEHGWVYVNGFDSGILEAVFPDIETVAGPHADPFAVDLGGNEGWVWPGHVPGGLWFPAEIDGVATVVYARATDSYWGIAGAIVSDIVARNVVGDWTRWRREGTLAARVVLAEMGRKPG